MKTGTLLSLLVAVMVFSFPDPAASVTVKEGGVTLEVNRVLTGVTTSTKYYGFTSGRIILPHGRGGLLTFSLWNDMSLNGTAHTNFFIVNMGGRQIKIPSYATRNQLLEEYNEFRGQWGPAGISRIKLAVPQGVSSFSFKSTGSPTGIELSHLQFANGYFSFPKGYEAEPVRAPGRPIINVSRVLTGDKTKESYYGFAKGTIFLPHAYGGFLSFFVYNDQTLGCSAYQNKINIRAGHLTESFTQYTTSMDLLEEYEQFKNQWGPAGGSRVIIQVPEEVSEITFDNKGSDSGIEIAKLHFSTGTPVYIQFEERVNRRGAVCTLFGRTLHGGDSGREFKGYASGRVILPNNKGGVLSLKFWNDQNVNQARTENRLHITAGSATTTVKQITTNTQRIEFYQEFMNQWGPAGGKPVRVKIPRGITEVSFDNQGSQTGFELTDFNFRSN